MKEFGVYGILRIYLVTIFARHYFEFLEEQTA